MRSALLVLVTAASLAACSTGGSVVPSQASPTTGELWSGVIQPAAGTTVQGAAVMQRAQNGNLTRIIVSVFGAPAGSVLPWHVHAGKCGDNGAVLGDPAAYEPLVVGTDGEARGLVTMPGALPTTGSYYVNVHQSAAAMTTIIGCGNLTYIKR